jgi:hypothetical protein
MGEWEDSTTRHKFGTYAKTAFGFFVVLVVFFTWLFMKSGATAEARPSEYLGEIFQAAAIFAAILAWVLTSYFAVPKHTILEREQAMRRAHQDQQAHWQASQMVRMQDMRVARREDDD